MIRIAIPLLVVISFGCQPTVEIAGLDVDKWKDSAPCDDYRITGANLILDNEDALLGITQRDIEGIFGTSPRHELGKRSEKFFYYPITINCDSIPNQSLQFRFDALARTKEILIVRD